MTIVTQVKSVTRIVNIMNNMTCIIRWWKQQT